MWSSVNYKTINFFVLTKKLLFLFCLAISQNQAALAQNKPCANYQTHIVATHKNPMVICNGSINALSNMDASRIICMDKPTGDVRCERFGALGAAGVWKIDSRQQFKSQTLKRVMRNCGIDLLDGDAMAINGIIIDNLNTRLAIGAIRKMEIKKLLKPVKLVNGKEIDTVYIVWTDFL